MAKHLHEAAQYIHGRYPRTGARRFAILPFSSQKAPKISEGSDKMVKSRKKNGAVPLGEMFWGFAPQIPKILAKMTLKLRKFPIFSKLVTYFLYVVICCYGFARMRQFSENRKFAQI